MRLIKPTIELLAHYLHEGEVYEIASLNGGRHHQIYFKNVKTGAGTSVCSFATRRMIKEGLLVFVD